MVYFPFFGIFIFPHGWGGTIKGPQLNFSRVSNYKMSSKRLVKGRQTPMNFLL